MLNLGRVSASDQDNIIVTEFGKRFKIYISVAISLPREKYCILNNIS